jgi:enolase
VINGGRYGSLTQAFNEFLIVPYGTDSVDFAIEMAIDVFQRLPELLERRFGVPPQVASSYGYAAPSEDPAEILSLMLEAIDACGHGGRIALALDCASSEMYDRNSGRYLLKGRQVGSDELIDYARALTERFPLVFIEDLLDENDWDGFSKAVRELPRTLILGDDLTVSNAALLRRAFETRAVDGFILKPNQVGTITEAMEAHDFARERRGRRCGDGFLRRSAGAVPEERSAAVRRTHRETELPHARQRRQSRLPHVRYPALAPVLTHWGQWLQFKAKEVATCIRGSTSSISPSPT